MPEGDTIHKIAAYMAELLRGQRLRQARAAHSRLPELEGAAVVDVNAVGKHLLVDCGAWVLRVHLGMRGDWHRYAMAERWRRPAWQASVVLASSRDVFVCFNAQDVECVRPTELRGSIIGALGPDLLASDCDLVEVVRRARTLAEVTPIVDVLLNQHVAAGLGNVYKSELLFMHAWHPLRPLQRLTDAQLHSVFGRGQALMQANLGGWQRTTTYDRRMGSQTGSRVYVYGRKGEPCFTCDTAILRADLGQHRRSTYWCPACQTD